MLITYDPQDIGRVLRALASAGTLHGPEYHKALHDVGLAFEVPNPKMMLPTWYVVDNVTSPLLQQSTK